MRKMLLQKHVFVEPIKMQVNWLNTQVKFFDNVKVVLSCLNISKTIHALKHIIVYLAVFNSNTKFMI